MDQGLNIQPGEGPAVVAGLLLFYLLFTGYFMLRPVRETMGVAGGVDNLQWLFTGTFVATLACLPLFGWLASKVRRRHILPWTYGFFTSNLLLFAVLFARDPDADGGQGGNRWLFRHLGSAARQFDCHGSRRLCRWHYPRLVRLRHALGGRCALPRGGARVDGYDHD